MAKGFKLRLSRVITSFKSCRSKDPSTLPQDPVPSCFRPPPLNHKLVTVDFSIDSSPSKPHPRRSSFKCHVFSALTKRGCGFSSRPDSDRRSHHDSTGSQHFKWRKEEKWHVVANIYDEAPRRKLCNSSASGDSDNGISTSALPCRAEKRRRRPKKKKMASKHRVSTSSADSGWFSSDERAEEETETLVSSSRSFSTDSSSEFNPHLETIREAPVSMRQYQKPKKKVTKPSSKRSVSCAKDKQRLPISFSTEKLETPARLSVFKKLIPCRMEGKVKESFAIVKKSQDPFEDFKSSMIEMILEKQLFEKDDLEQLLECFLSLNSRCYHGVIIEALSDIWEGLFATPSADQRSRLSMAL